MTQNHRDWLIIILATLALALTVYFGPKALVWISLRIANSLALAVHSV